MKTITGETFLGREVPVNYDTNAHWIGPHQEPTHYVDCVFDARASSEALKITRGATGHKFTRCHFYGGREDCVDLLGALDITFTDCRFFVTKSRYLATIKGGSERVTFYSPQVFGVPRHKSLFDVGGHTMYENPHRYQTRTIYVFHPKVSSEKRLWFVFKVWYAEKVYCFTKHPAILEKLSLPRWFCWLWFKLADL